VLLEIYTEGCEWYLEFREVGKTEFPDPGKAEIPVVGEKKVL
jgi:hypothetical protein